MKKEWQCIDSHYLVASDLTRVVFHKGLRGLNGHAAFMLRGDKTSTFKMGVKYAIGYE